MAVHYVDTVTEPGPDTLLAQGSVEAVVAIQDKVRISVVAHRSRVIAIAGHHDCAGNPVSKQEHLEQIAKAAAVIASWQLPVRVVGLWVNGGWRVDEVCDAGPVVLAQEV